MARTSRLILRVPSKFMRFTRVRCPLPFRVIRWCLLSRLVCFRRFRARPSAWWCRGRPLLRRRLRIIIPRRWAQVPFIQNRWCRTWLFLRLLRLMGLGSPWWTCRPFVPLTGLRLARLRTKPNFQKAFLKSWALSNSVSPVRPVVYRGNVGANPAFGPPYIAITFVVVCASWGPPRSKRGNGHRQCPLMS